MECCRVECSERVNRDYGTEMHGIQVDDESTRLVTLCVLCYSCCCAVVSARWFGQVVSKIAWSYMIGVYDGLTTHYVDILLRRSN